VINGYLLALAALFALGGKISDVVGHRRMVLVGTVGSRLPRCCAASRRRAQRCVDVNRPDRRQLPALVEVA
jgi:hypothetical protein